MGRNDLFNPMKAFKHMHHDKLLVGEGSTYVPIKCWAFLYSRTDMQTYRVPKYSYVSLIEQSDYQPSYEYYEMQRISGPCEDGYYLYAIIQEPETHYQPGQDDSY